MAGSRNGSGTRSSKRQTKDKEDIEAPPKIQCVVCEGYFNDSDKLIICERCKDFICIGENCANMSDTEWSVMSKPNNHWYCSNCNAAAMQAVMNDKAIEDRCREFLEQYEQRLSKVESELTNKASKSDLAETQKEVNNKIEEVNKRVEELDTKITEGASNLNRQDQDTSINSVEQFADRMRRQKNVVIYGIEESKSNLKDRSTADDRKAVKSIYSIVTGNRLKEEDFSVIRLGSAVIPKGSSKSEYNNGTSDTEEETENRPTSSENQKRNSRKRPLLVKFCEERFKMQLKRNLRNLKDSDYDHISVKDDMNKEDRVMLKRMVNEAEEKNKNTVDPHFEYRVIGETWDRKVVKVRKRGPRQADKEEEEERNNID